MAVWFGWFGSSEGASGDVGAGEEVLSSGELEPLTTATFSQLQVSIKDIVVCQHSMIYTYPSHFTSGDN